MEIAVTSIEDKIGYVFEDKYLCWEALQTKFPQFPDGSKRLALIGDAYMKTTLLRLWYPGGQSTAIANSMMQRLSNDRLAYLGRYYLEIVGVIQPNQSMQGNVGDGSITDSMKAIFGAVVIDLGREDLEIFKGILQTMGIRVDVSREMDSVELF